MVRIPKEKMSREELLEHIRRLEADRGLSPIQMLSEGYRILHEEGEKARKEQKTKPVAIELKEAEKDPGHPLELLKRAYKMVEEK